MPATDIFEIADTVIVRPDPVAVAAWVARLFEGRVHRALALAIVHEDEQAGAGRLGSAASRRPRRRERCRRPGLSLLSAGRPDGLNRLREVARARRLGAREGRSAPQYRPPRRDMGDLEAECAPQTSRTHGKRASGTYVLGSFLLEPV